MGMLAGVTDCGRIWKWGCRGRSDLNPGTAAIPSQDHVALEELGTRGCGRSQDHAALAEVEMKRLG